MNQRTIENFHLTAKSLGLNYLIIGGFAASYWGKPRFTADIDYVILDSSFEDFKKVLDKINYILIFLHPKGSFAHFAPKESSGFRIDLMIVENETWNKLFESAANADFGGSEPYPVVSSEHLIAMKLHSAKQVDRKEYLKDLNDISEIMLEQNISFEDLEHSGIIQKHGTEKTINELKKLIKSKSQ